MKQTNDKRFKKIEKILYNCNKQFKKIKNNFVSLIFILMIMLFLLMGNSVNANPINTSNEYKTTITVQSPRNKQQVKEELILEVSRYINSITSKSHEYIPRYLVHAGLNHDIDICFMMAQTKIETCFGTTGIGKSKRSLFGIISRSYSNYELAINDWCLLLKKSYLTKGRTEQSLMSRYTTIGGLRYAANPRYEQELRSAYNNIKRNTKIYSLQEEYKRM